ncbi:TIGR02391 family protein [Streptomyces virginiae]|uniref:TIGR02391 family protein n=1 Tax=Streptomyces virginiae TaxID=1961 RepID=UPI003692B133
MTSKSGGPLSDPAAPSGEVDGTMMLFRGAYAVLRNPSGHREVSFDDVTEASEAVMTASLLMRMLDKIERRLK